MCIRDRLSQPKNQELLRTKFVSCLMASYWKEFQKKIKWKLFVPFIAYFLAMNLYMVRMMNPENINSPVCRVLYYPLYGFSGCSSGTRSL